MSVTEQRSRLTAAIWQSVAQSGVDLSAIPQEAQASLVEAISTGVLEVVDGLLDEAAGPPDSLPPTLRSLAATPPADPAPAGAMGEDEEDETILWEGRPFLSLRVRYQITSERIRIVEGMVGREREDIELVRVQDIDQSQGVGERMANLGDIHIRSHDPSSPALVLRNVRDPQTVHEILRRAVLEARKRHGLGYREEM